MTIAFATPLALLLLAAPLALRMLRPRPAAAPGGLLVPEGWRDALPGGRSEGPPSGPGWLAVLAWAALVVALAGPRERAPSPALPASGRDIMLALDLSGSMVSRDFTLDGQPASRIDALKRVGSGLLRALEGNRVGLVVFADHAYAASPLTFDMAAIDAALQQMEIGLVGRSTAIGDGLGLALKRLAASRMPARAVILLSDGANDAGSTDPAEVAALARRLGIRLYTIALGVRDTSDPQGDPDPVDFATLQRLAEIGGGVDFRVRSTDELAAATASLAALLPGKAESPAGVGWRDLWSYPALVAGLALLGMLVPVRPRIAA